MSMGATIAPMFTSTPPRPGPCCSQVELSIFDDYEWSMMQTEAERPKLGVDAFLAAQAGQYRELHRRYQIIIERN
jgi:hypothetical protein